MASNLSNKQLTDWLRLIRSENIGPATFRKLLNRYGSASAALDALPFLSSRGGKNTALKAPTLSEIEDEIASIEQLGARIITQADDEFPTNLKHIASSPPILTILGAEGLRYNQSVAIVGARNASAAGQRLTKTIAAELGEAGYVIISGLARGIDTSAHSASLSTGTIAVFAGGLDCIYPQENISLAKQIVENGGALITEMPLGLSPRAKDFPRRNRLVSGISKGVVIIEAAKRSGSLITARLALEQNREVFAVPGSPLDPRSAGPNSLIKQGATLVSCADDILESLENALPYNNQLFENDDNSDFSYGFSMRAEQGNEANQIDESIYSDEPSQNDRENLLNALSLTPISVDEIVEQTKISTTSIQTILLELDIAGRIEWASGQLVSLKQ